MTSKSAVFKSDVEISGNSVFKSDVEISGNSILEFSGTSSKLGINMTPSNTLDVSGNVGLIGSLTIDQRSDDSGLIINRSEADVDITSSSGSNNLVLSVGNTSNDMIFETGESERVRIDNVGNVGIGTDSPNASYKLDVDGSVNIVNNLDVSGGVNVHNNLVLGGDLTVNGNDINMGNGATIVNTTGDRLVITEAVVELAGDVSINSNLDIVGDINSVVNIDGTGDLSINTITMTGFSVNSSGDTEVLDLTVNGNDITMGNGATIVNTDTSTLTVTEENVVLSGDLTVSGNNINFSNSVSVDNETSGEFDINANETNLSGNIKVSGNNIKSSTGVNALVLSGENVKVGGNLEVSGNYITMPNGAIIDNQNELILTIDESTIELAGDVSINEDLNIGGSLLSITNIRGTGDLSINTITMTDFEVDADGNVITKSINNSSGGITYAGAISGVTSLTVSGDLTIDTDTLVVDSANDNVGINKTPNSNYSLDVSGNMKISNDVDISGIMTVEQDSVFDNSLNVLGKLHIGPHQVYNETLNVNGTFRTSSNSYFGDNIRINNKTDAEPGMQIKHDDYNGYIGWKTGNLYIQTQDASYGDDIMMVIYNGGDVSFANDVYIDGSLNVGTNIHGTGDLSINTITMTGFSVDADGDVVTKSIDNSDGGITNAGAISGVNTLNASGDVSFGSDLFVNTNTLVVDSTNNNVGIGTSSPDQSYKLVVDGNAIMGDCCIKTSGDYFYIGHNDIADEIGDSFIIRQANDGTTAINAKSGKSIGFNIGNSGKMQIDSAGNLGIGTSPSASYKLNVNGSANINNDLDVGGDLTVTGNDITFGNNASIVNTNTSTLTITEATTVISGDLNVTGQSTLGSLYGQTKIYDTTGRYLNFGNGSSNMHHVDFYNASSTSNPFYLNYYSGTDIRFFAPANNNVFTVYGHTEISGNLNIGMGGAGDSNPESSSYKLDVDGNARVTDELDVGGDLTMSNGRLTTPQYIEIDFTGTTSSTSAHFFWLLKFDEDSYSENCSTMINVNYSVDYRRTGLTHGRYCILNGTLRLSSYKRGHTDTGDVTQEYAITDDVHTLAEAAGYEAQWYYISFNGYGYLGLACSSTYTNNFTYKVKANISILSTRPTVDIDVFNGTVYCDFADGGTTTTTFTSMSEVYPSTGTSVTGWDSTMTSSSSADIFEAAFKGISSGDVTIGGTNFNIGDSDSQSGNRILNFNSGTEQHQISGYTNRLHIQSTGYIDFGVGALNGSSQRDMVLTSDGLGIGGDPDTGRELHVHGDIKFDGTLYDSNGEFSSGGGAFEEDANQTYAYYNNKIHIGSTSSPSYQLEVEGTVEATNFVATSDERKKKNIQALESPLEKIMKLQGRNYTWNDSCADGLVGKKSSGFIAQEVEKIIPEVVMTRPPVDKEILEKNKDTNTDDGDEGDCDDDKKEIPELKGIDYNGLVPYLVECIKELKTELDINREELKTTREILKANNMELYENKREISALNEKLQKSHIIKMK